MPKEWEDHLEAIRNSDKGLPAYLNLGLDLRAQNRLAEAKECFVRAIELDPEYGSAREALEEVEKALAHLAERA